MVHECNYDGENVGRLYPGGVQVDLLVTGAPQDGVGGDRPGSEGDLSEQPSPVTSWEQEGQVAFPGAKRVLRSRVLEMDQYEMVLSWPEPAPEKVPLGMSLEVTVVCQEAPGPRRWGYATTVLDVAEADWRGRGPEPVLVVLPPTPRDLGHANLRGAPRYAVPQGGFLTLAVEGLAQVELVDISLHGLRLRVPGDRPPPARGESLSMRLGIWEAGFDVRGKVVSTAPDDGGMACSVALETLSLDVRVELVSALKLLDDHAIN